MTLQEALYEECYKRQFELYEYSKVREQEIINSDIPNFWRNVNAKIRGSNNWEELFYSELTLQLDLITLKFSNNIITFKDIYYTKVEIIENNDL